MQCHTTKDTSNVVQKNRIWYPLSGFHCSILVTWSKLVDLGVIIVRFSLVQYVEYVVCNYIAACSQLLGG